MRIKDLKQLWQAARDGDLNTLPEQVTKEDLQYEDEEDGMKMSALLVAACKGHDKIIQLLLQSNKVDINQKSTEDERTALMYASQYGNLSTVKLLAIKGAAIDVQDKEGDTALIKASKCGKQSIVKFLLKQGAAINVQDEDGNTALIYACKEGKDSVVKVLLQAGADKDVQNEEGKTALSVTKKKSIIKLFDEHDQSDRTVQTTPVIPPSTAAVDNAEQSSIASAISQDAPLVSAENTGQSGNGVTLDLGTKIWQAVCDSDVNTLSQLLPQATAENLQYEGEMDDTKMSALLVTAHNGHLEIIQLLLQSNKVDINQKNSEDGSTALMQASRHGKRYVVEYLVQQGAATNVQDNVGETALIKASKHSCLAVVKLLVTENTAINTQDKDRWTALMQACRYGKHTIVEYLVQQGADIHIKDKNGWTAFICAARYGKLTVLQVLVQQEVDINIQSNDEETALIKASMFGKLDVVQFLIDQGASINKQGENKSKRTALMQACKNGHLAVVEYLVEKGAAIDMQDKDGDTTLIKASKYGHLSIVEYLVQQGADIHVFNQNNETALSLAKTEEIRKILNDNIENTTVEQGGSTVVYARSGDSDNAVNYSDVAAAVNMSTPSTTALPSVSNTSWWNWCC